MRYKAGGLAVLGVLCAVFVGMAMSSASIAKAVPTTVQPTVQPAADAATQIAIAFGIASFLALVGLLAVKSRRASSILDF